MFDETTGGLAGTGGGGLAADPPLLADGAAGGRDTHGGGPHDHPKGGESVLPRSMGAAAMDDNGAT